MIVGSAAALGREIELVLAEIFVNRAWRQIAFFLLPYVGVVAGLDVAAHYGEATGALLPAQFYISKDMGFGEYLEYALLSATAAMLLLMWARSRAGTYLVNAMLFAYLAADDALQFHERFGQSIAPWMPQGLPLPPNDVGEIVLFAFIGIVWAGSLLVALARAELRPAAQCLVLAAGVAGAAFFGVVADAVTSWGEKSIMWIELEAWLEDGGEFVMIIACFLACCAMFDIERRRPEGREEPA